ncbi:MAG: alpha-N-arabinofuranosidase [Paludibacter sp.]|jgi:alpha-N-arabinofuranosidase|nr:alpha-N-arabinofuranosidase [Paludibacter sp.]
MKKHIFLLIALVSVAIISAQEQSSISLRPDSAKQIINKNIYGHFAEHLGTCIYGGLWVGENSPIANINGYRKDVFEALKKLEIPVLRWPGGCFADEYHWMDGVGAKANRPKLVNNNWGGTVEDNSFGTHEFLNLCEMLGAEPYISGNVGSGSVEELAKWVQYMTSDSDNPMANLRRQNGREKAWKVKYLGVGNESWGCGGDMLPEYYSDLYRRYAIYCRNYDDNRLFKIASGASDFDYNWTDVLMKKIGNKMNGISVHYYTVTGWNGSKGSATQFTPDEYYWITGKCLDIEDVIKGHIAIMDKYDTKKNIALLVDEWGTWFDEEPGTVRGHLYQQNTMRDAFVAALSLNIFNKYSDRVKMANIAQIANVLQSMVLTRDDKMVLTPTYHVFEMYRVHQDALHIPLEITCATKEIRGRQVPLVSASASVKNNLTHISLANISLDSSQEITINLNAKATNITARILTSKNISDHNTFDKPETVKPADFKDFKLTGNTLKVKLPAKAIVMLEVK